MADFISQIQNIANIYPPTTIRTPEIKQIATILSHKTADSVNFSNESKNLFEISQIDKNFDQILSLPRDLNEINSNYKEKLAKIAKDLFLNGSLQKSSIDFDAIGKTISKIYHKSDLSKKDRKTLVNLSASIQTYMQNQLISQLISPSSPIQTTKSILTTNLNQEDITNLAKISKQLNRVLLTPTNSEGSLFLDSINSLFALNNPSNKEKDDIFSLFTNRNILLSSIILNRNLDSNYAVLI